IGVEAHDPHRGHPVKSTDDTAVRWVCWQTDAGKTLHLPDSGWLMHRHRHRHVRHVNPMFWCIATQIFTVIVLVSASARSGGPCRSPSIRRVSMLVRTGVFASVL